MAAGAARRVRYWAANPLLPTMQPRITPAATDRRLLHGPGERAASGGAASRLCLGLRMRRPQNFFFGAQGKVDLMDLPIRGQCSFERLQTRIDVGIRFAQRRVA